MFSMCAVTMKFVVTGRSLRRRRMSASARYWEKTASELKRWKSSSCPGLRADRAARGGRISSQS